MNDTHRYLYCRYLKDEEFFTYYVEKENEEASVLVVECSCCHRKEEIYPVTVKDLNAQIAFFKNHHTPPRGFSLFPSMQIDLDSSSKEKSV